MTFGERLRTWREKHGLSPEHVAVAAGVSRRTVDRWEAGSSVPGVDDIRALEEAYRGAWKELTTGVPAA
jgi:transcriptional regulator with XRE-family HTH domain